MPNLLCVRLALTSMFLEALQSKGQGHLGAKSGPKFPPPLTLTTRLSTPQRSPACTPRRRYKQIFWVSDTCQAATLQNQPHRPVLFENFCTNFAVECSCLRRFYSPGILAYGSSGKKASAEFLPSDFQVPGSLVLCCARRETLQKDYTRAVGILPSVSNMLSPLRRTATATTSIMTWVWSAAKLEPPPAVPKGSHGRTPDECSPKPYDELEPEAGTPCLERPSSTASRSTP